MPVFTKGSFKVNLGFVQIGGEFDELDRQCAWELYCEIVTRVAVRGSLDADGNEVFDGEVYAESLDSLYNFFLESRQIMKRYPVGPCPCCCGTERPGSVLVPLRPALLEEDQSSGARPMTICQA